MFASKSTPAQAAVPKAKGADARPKQPINRAWQSLALSRAGAELSAGAFTIRRAVPVNVPHPDNQPWNAFDEETPDAAPVRRALKVGRSDDPMELEAEQVAERVMRMPLSGGASPDATGLPPVTAGSGGRSLAPE